MTICLFEKAKRFAEFGDDASVTTVKITRRGRFSNWWAFPILECNYYTIDETFFTAPAVMAYQVVDYDSFLRMSILHICV